MRIALVSPYSWTYPGGVTRHIEALAGQFLAQGHDVRVLAPYDPDDRLSVRLHRGARPQGRPLPEYVVPLGRTVTRFACWRPTTRTTVSASGCIAVPARRRASCPTT